MASALIWTLVIFLPSVIQSKWHHRYDLLTLNQMSIQDVFDEFTVPDECSCRKRCVEDEECAAASVSPMNKSKLKCSVSHLYDSHKDLNKSLNSITFLKERKPKLFFWSTRKTVNPDEHNEVCSAEGGNVGTIFSLQDVQYVRDNLMPQVTDNYGYFIPLRGSKANNKITTTWQGLNFGAEDPHPLYQNFEDGATGSGSDICFKISPTGGLTLRALPCNKGPEVQILCYKYES